MGQSHHFLFKRGEKVLSRETAIQGFSHADDHLQFQYMTATGRKLRNNESVLIVLGSYSICDTIQFSNTS